MNEKPASSKAKRGAPAPDIKETTGNGVSGRAHVARAERPVPRPATTTSQPKPKHNKTTWKQLTRGQKSARVALWAAICLVTMLIVGLVVSLVYYRSVELPDPNADFQTSNTSLYFRDGTSLLGTLAVQNRVKLDYADMPQSMKDAVVAAEDRTFWTNRGISVPGIARAAWNIVRGHDVQSGSTLTQQYVKTMYLTSEQTLSRKVKEMVLSLKMTNTYTKEQILQGYLNAVYFGRGAYGIQAAAQAFFGVDAAELTVPQAAVLTCMLRAPSLYEPSKEENLTRLLDRYNYVIAGMVETGTLTQALADQYKGSLPEFPEIKTSDRYGGPNGFLMKMVEDELENVVGLTEAEIAGGGLTVTTTFDKTMQKAAVASAQKYTKQSAENARTPQDPSKLHAAIASVGVGTGEVLALYGGPDYVQNSRNWATSHRATGSTFKPFAFVAALRNGLSLNTQLTGNTIRVDGETIHNAGRSQYGQVNLLRATQSSINTAFVDLVQKINNGPNEVIQAAQDAGAPQADGWAPVPYIPLGSAEVSPLDMANSYATFANGGIRVAGHVVLEVKDAIGNVVYSANPTRTNAIDPSICRDLTYALQSVVDAGTGVAARSLDYPAAGKTGTNGMNGGVSASWFVGYTQQISTAVMYVAGDAGTSDLNPYSPPGTSSFYGSGYPVRTWVDYMKVAMKGLPHVEFNPPAFVNGGRPIETPTETPTPEETPTVDIPTETPTEELPTETPTYPPPTHPTPTLPPITPPTETPTPPPPE